MMSPRIFAWSTTSNDTLSMLIASRSCLSLLKSILSSLHFSGFNCNLLSTDQFSTVVASDWMRLRWFFGTTSEIVVSSTNFHILESLTDRSFTINKNSQGPSLCGTPDGMCFHDEYASASLTLWYSGGIYFPR